MRSYITKIAQLTFWIVLFAILIVNFGCSPPVKLVTVANQDVLVNGFPVTNAVLPLPLKKGDRINTSSGGSGEIRFSGPATGNLVLNPYRYHETMVEYQNFSWRVWMGTVWSRTSGYFQVNTDYVQAAVRGTEFYVTNTGNVVKVYVKSGTVGLFPQGGAYWNPVEVFGGEQAIIRGLQSPTIGPQIE